MDWNKTRGHRFYNLWRSVNSAILTAGWQKAIEYSFLKLYSGHVKTTNETMQGRKTFLQFSLPCSHCSKKKTRKKVNKDFIWGRCKINLVAFSVMGFTPFCRTDFWNPLIFNNLFWHSLYKLCYFYIPYQICILCYNFYNPQSLRHRSF